MAIRRRIDVDVISHPEQYIAGMAAAIASSKALKAELAGSSGASAVQQSLFGSEAELAGAGAIAAGKTSASFLSKFQSSLSSGFGRFGKSALTDVGEAIGGDVGGVFGSSFATAAGSSLQGALPYVIGGVAAFGALKGALDLADTTAKYEDEVRTIAQITGDSAHGASLLVGELKGLGIETSSTERPLQSFAKTLENGGGALKGFFDRYQSMKDPIDKDAFAMAAFGQRGVVKSSPFATVSRSSSARCSLVDERHRQAAQPGLLQGASRSPSAKTSSRRSPRPPTTWGR